LSQVVGKTYTWIEVFTLVKKTSKIMKSSFDPITQGKTQTKGQIFSF